MAKKQAEKTIALKDIEKILDKQTSVILSAVDERLAVTKIDILSSVDEKLKKMEIRIDQKFDRLATTLDKFLKRLTDVEECSFFSTFVPQSGTRS
ncbi:MAG: hypothetical protein Q7S82_03445 [bacterium]|nr:hypothetical protein [bacterium]